MSQQNVNLVGEVLVIGGVAIPLGGADELWRIVPAARANGVDVIGGGSIHVATGFNSAVLTVSAHTESARHQAMLAILSRDEVRRQTGVPDRLGGTARKAGESWTWSDATITQAAEAVSSATPQVVVWTLSLSDVRRLAVPVEVLP